MHDSYAKFRSQNLIVDILMETGMSKRKVRQSSLVGNLFSTIMTMAVTGTSKNNRFNEQKNNSARASRFFVHFFAFTTQLRREMTKF